jgi:hypothetical protein
MALGLHRPRRRANRRDAFSVGGAALSIIFRATLPRAEHEAEIDTHCAAELSGKDELKAEIDTPRSAKVSERRSVRLELQDDGTVKEI